MLQAAQSTRFWPVAVQDLPSEWVSQPLALSWQLNVKERSKLLRFLHPRDLIPPWSLPQICKQNALGKMLQQQTLRRRMYQCTNANLFVASCLCNISQCTKKRLSSALFLIWKWSFRCHETCGANGATWPELQVPGQRLYYKWKSQRDARRSLRSCNWIWNWKLYDAFGKKSHGIWYAVPPQGRTFSKVHNTKPIALANDSA